MTDKIPIEDYNRVMDALEICAKPLDEKTGQIRRCRDCYFDKKRCLLGLMMATHEIMKRMKPLVEKAQEGGEDE